MHSRTREASELAYVQEQERWSGSNMDEFYGGRSRDDRLVLRVCWAEKHSQGVAWRLENGLLWLELRVLITW